MPKTAVAADVPVVAVVVWWFVSAIIVGVVVVFRSRCVV